MNYFPKSDEEISLIKFISKYQYLNINKVGIEYLTYRITKNYNDKYIDSVILDIDK